MAEATSGGPHRGMALTRRQALVAGCRALGPAAIGAGAPERRAGGRRSRRLRLREPGRTDERRREPRACVVKPGAPQGDGPPGPALPGRAGAQLVGGDHPRRGPRRRRGRRRRLGLAGTGPLLAGSPASPTAGAQAPTPIGAYTTKDAWSFVSALTLHPPKLRTDTKTQPDRLARGNLLAASFPNVDKPGPMDGQRDPLILDGHIEPVQFKPLPT